MLIAARPPDSLTVPVPAATASARGLDLLAADCFQEALEPLRLAFSFGDTRPATLLNLAIAEDRAGDRIYAQDIMNQVAARLPDWDEPVLRLAESLRAAGDLAGAEHAYRRTLSLNPTRIEALIALAGLLMLRNQLEPAIDLLRLACDQAPDNAEAWNTLGRAYQQTGAIDLALVAFRTARRLQPRDVSYGVNVVDAAVLAEDAEVESERLEHACAQDPLNPAYQAARGMLLDRMGRRAAAIEALEAACALAPEAIAPMRLLGGLLARSSQAARAETVLRQVAERCPDSAQARNDHAAILMRVHRHAEARAILQDTLDRHGPDAAIMCNLANATACVGLQAEAVALARQAIALQPDALLPLRALCNTLPYLHGTSGQALLAAMRACSAAVPRTPQPPLCNDPDPDRPLTIGLLSGSLRTHPVGWLTVAGIECLNPDSFSIVCLAQNTAPHDPIARRYRAAASAWVEVDSLNDDALVAAARAQDIDILIDLGGYGDASRMTACASRLAPVQIKWVGMQAHSSGLAEMDWFLTDRWETPAGFEPLYSERLLRLPDGYVCYSPPTYAPAVKPLPALKNGYVTFGCFNNLAKITPELLATWAIILRRIPDSRLVLKTHQLSDPATAERLVSALTGEGVTRDRVETRGSSGHRAFMGEYNDIDIVLDPFPYSGGLTTCEALWMGVPTITRPGEIFASRHSVSHLSNAGLADWVAGSVADYVDMAIARAADLSALAALRADLRERVRLSPLCDAPRFGANLGAALRHVWRDWCARS
ncbi:MAG TPA: tetratricopeptide repeat protein [Rhodopila sp.]|nr:tetratricopeptide repeat protein [Rhodopila sp.]